MNKDVLYAKVKQATIEANLTLKDKAIEEMDELIHELKTARKSLVDRGTIENAAQLQDEMADVSIVTEQITGERYFIQKIANRFKFKIYRLAERLIHGGLFK